MKVLDLFSGIGGFSLGLERAGMETVAFCEIDPFCQKVLRKHWPDVPIYDDVRTLDYDGPVDVICGGYPCQPFSLAGNRKGEEDDRHLWPFMFSLIQKHRPAWVIGENVAGHISMGLDEVLSDLESESYTARAFVIPACSLNAPHRRDRIWIVAHSGRHENGQSGASNETRANTKNAGSNKNGDASNYRCERIQGFAKESARGQQAFSWCQNIGRIKDFFERPDIPKPLICRDDDGFSSRVDRLRSLGNAVVPQIPEIIGRAIMEAA